MACSFRRNVWTSCWNWRNGFERKLALADAAVGAGEVLPGRGPGHEVNLADDQVVDEFEKLLDAGGSSASLSGEEYRRRLYDAFGMEPMLKADVTSLPYGSGSGFVNPVVHGNGYVFCIKIGRSAKPWFRYVPVSDDWSIKYSDDGQPFVSPTRFSPSERRTRFTVVPKDGSQKGLRQGFRCMGWRAIAHTQPGTNWTDPNAFQPDLPLAFRRCLHPGAAARRLSREGVAN